MSLTCTWCWSNVKVMKALITQSKAEAAEVPELVANMRSMTATAKYVNVMDLNCQPGGTARDVL